MKITVQTLKLVLYITGGVFVLFAGLLVFTFISTSIKYKKKDIGTLRALGARGIDVGKIFITEALIILILSSLVANILSDVIIRVIDAFAVNQYKLQIVLLYTSGWSILAVIILAIFLVIISAYVPIKRITEQKPIDVIVRSE